MRLVLTLFVIALNFAGSQSATAPVQSPARPILEFEKTRFVVGEKVFFWVGVEVPGQKVPVPRELQDSLRVIVTRPNGSVRVDKVSFPIDGIGINGPGDLGFRGGWGLGAEIPQPGSWVVVVEFAGQRTQPVTFTVDNIPVLKDIQAEFVFSSPLVLNSPESTATLTVRNRSAEIIRFVELGQNHSYVAVSLDKNAGEKWGASFTVPSDVLAAASGRKIVPMSVDKFTWAATKQLPTVTLAPGAEYNLRLPVVKTLESLRSRAPAGTYDVTFSTELQLLVGEADGNWKDLVPIRLTVKSTTKGAQWLLGFANTGLKRAVK
jgi:hypothetical protein